LAISYVNAFGFEVRGILGKFMRITICYRRWSS